MPLIKKGSKKALEHNIKAEMEAHPDKHKQDLAIAFSVQRKAKHKKMAQGGEVLSAKHESRPMPESKYNDAQDISQNSGKKALKDADWTDAPQDRQAQRGPKFTPMKKPKMVPQNAYSVKMRDYEDDLVEHAAPAMPEEQPSERMNEEEADKSGPPVQHMKMMAKGGMINEEVSMHDAEEDEAQHPEGLESDDDEMSPEMQEYMSGQMAPRLAKGGSVEHEEDMQPMDEEEEEHHASIAAAIMARKKRAEGMLLADGGMVDLDENAMEEPNQEYGLEKAALKENYDEPLHSVHQPEDSNEHGDEHEMNAENEHDMISSIRRKMAMKKR